MKYHLGAHLSIAEGYTKAVEQAIAINADTFQFFTRNPRGGAAKEIASEDVLQATQLMVDHDFAPILAHSPYTINMASDKIETRENAKKLLRDDLDRLKLLPCKLYNVHPGSHKKQGVEKGIGFVCDALNAVLTSDDDVKVLIETMSGKGNELGVRFEEIRDMIAGVELRDKIGVCMDTCHMFCAGYDIVNDLTGVMEQFDRIVGFDRLYAVHLNDSRNPFDSRKDHHAKIGEGAIGLDAIRAFISHEAVSELPILLETPNELDGYRQEIELLQSK